MQARRNRAAERGYAAAAAAQRDVSTWQARQKVIAARRERNRLRAREKARQKKSAEDPKVRMLLAFVRQITARRRAERRPAREAADFAEIRAQRAAAQRTMDGGPPDLSKQEAEKLREEIAALSIPAQLPVELTEVETLPESRPIPLLREEAYYRTCLKRYPHEQLEQTAFKRRRYDGMDWHWGRSY